MYILFAAFCVGYIESSIIVTDFKHYSKIYSSKDELVAEFPSKIPKNAYDIKFYYRLGMPNDETIMNIYYKVNSSTMKNYKNKYGKIMLREEEISNDLYNTNNYKLYLKNIKINEDYNIYYLYDENNKYSYVALNEKTNECIFVFRY